MTIWHVLGKMELCIIRMNSENLDASFKKLQGHLREMKITREEIIHSSTQEGIMPEELTRLQESIRFIESDSATLLEKAKEILKTSDNQKAVNYIRDSILVPFFYDYKKYTSLRSVRVGSNRLDQ
ncbi:hypothetical protein [Zymomonas mobilis]|uniref:Uncharacterized protein n=1 Tax=Zymomonas mobilis subsp. pomaceae (strain ATCC 29192 / DSM 22645 / JCM 10191 / CCUG 17912 / NBRC 13757 / NCIMB 11200 / NRRL B-4491 / Barker I) TaxID=579138 RepID=F8EW95_ZYMMT|nr:hypothetical protein [Zymomonas mobilis]AEI38505.1 hypothetical protein Zymop_1616 [Zymomonas mobilis subsp. pomaceae ATCC 29192]MDX5948194.1 hypothetical protein [Zymomonas mobilis subsp. pomaceae]GEB89866.1 hypothetical protein ZMO02_15030 [Zymomonas mobilis subsp. pomaceae]